MDELRKKYHSNTDYSVTVANAVRREPMPKSFSSLQVYLCLTQVVVNDDDDDDDDDDWSMSVPYL